MTIAAIRAGLVAAVKPIGIDRTYTEDADSIEVPAVVIGNPTVTYDDDFDGDLTYTFPLVLVVSRAKGTDGAIRQLDPYVDPTGTLSVHAAIKTAGTLGGAAQSARVVRAVNYDARNYTWGTDEYAGVTFEVEVMAAHG